MKIKILALICFLSFWACEVSAQTKEENKILKGLKKEYKLKNAQYVDEPDGFSYIKLVTKDKKYAISVEQGNLRFPRDIKDFGKVVSVVYNR